VTIFSRRSPVLRRLYVAEGRADTVNFDVVNTSRRVWLFYGAVTLFCFILLYRAGMPLFDSVNHAFTGLATGGFSVKNGNIGAYDNLRVEIILMIFLCVGATNFVYMITQIDIQMRRLRKKTLRKWELNVELKGFLLLILFAIVTLTLVGKEDLRSASFQAISAITNCGFQTRALVGWSDFNKMILSLLMIAGGSSGSTAGAVKIFRVEIFFLSVYWYFKRLMLPEHAVFTKRFGKRDTSYEETVHVIQYIIVYLLFLMGGAMALTASGHSFVNSFFEVASAIGNTGLSVGITSMGMPASHKLLLTFEMWFGRVEIFPALILLLYPLRR